MTNETNLMGFLAIVAGMVIFKATSNVPAVEGYFVKFPLIMIGLGFLLFFNRDKIVKRVKGK